MNLFVAADRTALQCRYAFPVSHFGRKRGQSCGKREDHQFTCPARARIARGGAQCLPRPSLAGGGRVRCREEKTTGWGSPRESAGERRPERGPWSGRGREGEGWCGGSSGSSSGLRGGGRSRRQRRVGPAGHRPTPVGGEDPPGGGVTPFSQGVGEGERGGGV